MDPRTEKALADMGPQMSSQLPRGVGGSAGLMWGDDDTEEKARAGGDDDAYGAPRGSSLAEPPPKRHCGGSVCAAPGPSALPYGVDGWGRQAEGCHWLRSLHKSIT